LGVSGDIFNPTLCDSAEAQNIPSLSERECRAWYYRVVNFVRPIHKHHADTIRNVWGYVIRAVGKCNTAIRFEPLISEANKRFALAGITDDYVRPVPKPLEILVQVRMSAFVRRQKGKFGFDYCAFCHDAQRRSERPARLFAQVRSTAVLGH
jgi:hypothetical protein